MSDELPTPIRSTRTSRSFRLCLAMLLIALSFSLGAAVTAFIAVRLFLPVAGAGWFIGIAALSLAAATEMKTTLMHGNSEQRLMVLTQLRDSLSTPNAPPIDSQVVEWITPALTACQEDGDPKVVELATDLLQSIVDNTAPVVP